MNQAIIERAESELVDETAQFFAPVDVYPDNPLYY